MLRKNCSTDRFFDGGFVRLTQPSAQNDPDEARPDVVIGKFAREDYEDARQKAARAGLTSPSDEDLELFLQPFPRLRYDEKSFPMLWPKSEPRLRDKPFRTSDEFDHAVAERAVKIARNAADETLGFVSLSDSAGEQMWAYYAADHTGIAICFDESHPFFVSARRVTYSSEPFFVSSNSGWIRIGGVRWESEDILDGRVVEIPSELFFRKRTGWSHEGEWRLVRPLAGALKLPQHDANGFAFHMIEVPPAAVRGVIFGYRAADNAIGATMHKIAKTGRWQHIEVWRRRSSDTGVIEEDRLA